eukprot:2413314-Rhodomonas_salina.1
MRFARRSFASCRAHPDSRRERATMYSRRAAHALVCAVPLHTTQQTCVVVCILPRHATEQT